MNNVDGEYYRTESGVDYEILRRRVSIAQLVKDSAFSNVVTMLNLKCGIYQEISLQQLFLEEDTLFASRELKRTWTRWLCENGYIKEVKKEDEIKVGDFVKVKDKYFHCHPPHSLSELIRTEDYGILSELIRTEDYGIVKEKTEENIPYTCKVELLAHPSLSFYYRCKDLEKLNSDLFEKVVLFRMDEKGCIVPDHCVYRKRK